MTIRARVIACQIFTPPPPTEMFHHILWNPSEVYTIFRDTTTTHYHFSFLNRTKYIDEIKIYLFFVQQNTNFQCFCVRQFFSEEFHILTRSTAKSRLFLTLHCMWKWHLPVIIFGLEITFLPILWCFEQKSFFQILKIFQVKHLKF